MRIVIDGQQVHDFPHDMTPLEIAAHIKLQYAARLSGKYVKQVLYRLESDNFLNRTVRKHVLDGFNDYAREIEELLN